MGQLLKWRFITCLQAKQGAPGSTRLEERWSIHDSETEGAEHGHPPEEETRWRGLWCWGQGAPVPKERSCSLARARHSRGRIVRTGRATRLRGPRALGLFSEVHPTPGNLLKKCGLSEQVCSSEQVLLICSKGLF